MEEQDMGRRGMFRDDPAHLQQVRVKFREVFEYDASLDDEVLLRSFSITPDGDLIMKIP